MATVDLKDSKTPEQTLLTWTANNDVRKKMNSLVKSTMETYLNTEEALDSYNYGLLDGEPEFLEALSSFILQQEGVSIERSHLFPTYGSTYGFMLVMTHFFEANDVFFVEDLTFGAVVTQAQDFGMKVESVGCDDEGIDLKELERKIMKAKESKTHRDQERKPYWGLIYVLPVLHNPKGTSYSESRCRDLIALARKYSLLIISDDVYDVFQYYGDKTKKLLRYEDSSDKDYGDGHVISNASLSKVLFPSSRIGWIESSDWILSQLRTRVDLFAGGGYNKFMQILIAKVLKHERFDETFTEIKENYKKQLDFSFEYLKKSISTKVTFDKPKGSFFLWLALPNHLSSTELRQRCKCRGIEFMDGPFFTACEDKSRYANYFRVCVINYIDLEIEHALKILCEETNKYIEENNVNI